MIQMLSLLLINVKGHLREKGFFSVEALIRFLFFQISASVFSK